jgi:hypothetical protein
MYYRPERRLFLGTLTLYLGPDIFAFEIAPTDKAPPEMITQMFCLIKEHLGWPANLQYHPTSNALEMQNRLPNDVPIVLTEDLYDGAIFQAMHLGKTVGRVRLTTLSELREQYINRMDIVVVDSVPNDIPIVAGIVTGEFQTPLSHVNLLSQNRSTPNMALIDALQEADFRENDGKWIELIVRADGYTVNPASSEEAQSFWENKRPTDVQVPELDLSVRELVDIEQTDLSWIPSIGSKAAHFGEMDKITPPIPVPEAFSVPCFYYVDFIMNNGFDKEIVKLLDDNEFIENGRYRNDALADFRTKILSASVDDNLIDAIESKISDQFGDVSMRFRSSSNAEDLAEFNGAGLYDSATYSPGEPGRTIANALRTVWASQWNIAAFEEREW